MLAVYPARADPDRVVAVVKRGKDVEFVAFELSTGRRERLGPAPAAYSDAYWISADGRAVFRVDDPTGSELGHLVRLGVDGAGPILRPTGPTTPSAAARQAPTAGCMSRPRSTRAGSPWR